MKKRRKSRSHSRKLTKKQRRQRELAVKIAAAVVVVLTAVYVFLWFSVNKGDKEHIYNHVHIGEVDVSGMNREEAETALQAKVIEYGNCTGTFRVGEASAETTLQELGFEMEELSDAVEQAVKYGKEGSVWKRFIQLHKLKEETKVFEVQFRVEEQRMTDFIEESVQPLEQRAQDATIRSAAGGFEIVDEVAGTAVDTEKSIEELHTYLNKTWDYQDFVFEMEQIIEEPRIKRSDLEQIQDELGSFHTEAGSGTRVKNIQRAAELINGLVLMPGEEVSVEEMTAPYTLENGYVEGGAYENGQVVQSIGGGLCQMSSTLYNAVLYAELEIVTRSAHSMLVTYVEPSRDAAIAEGVKDLIFKNSYEYPVLIEGYVNDSGQVWFHIYGKETRAQNRRVEYVSETLEDIPYTKKFVADTELTLGETKNEGSKINGKKAKLWKVVYEDGVEVSRETRNNSSYKASELIVHIGIASDNTEASAYLQKAIASQDESAINAAISEAKAMESAGNASSDVQEDTP